MNCAIYTNHFNFRFSCLHTFYKPNKVKTKLAQKLKLIFKFNTIMEHINDPLWTHMGHKQWRKDGKTFISCYTIALKLRDEFNTNFVLVCFSSYSSIKMSQKCGEKQ